MSEGIPQKLLVAIPRRNSKKKLRGSLAKNPEAVSDFISGGNRMPERISEECS